MKKSLIEAKKVFNGILCLAVEGTEFYKTSDLLNAIRGEAVTGFEICKHALQPGVEADGLKRCDCEKPLISEKSYCTVCGRDIYPPAA